VTESLEQFVPSRVCLSCDGCCRFKEPKSAWRPKITKDEMTAMKKPDLLSVIYSKEKVEVKTGHLKTVPCESGGHHFCTFFAPQTNTCTIYDVRPFECRLYPFVLVKEKDKVVVSAHHACPYVQEKKDSEEFQKYAAYLKKYFSQKEIVDFVKRNPTLAGEYTNYKDELEPIFTVI